MAILKNLIDGLVLRTARPDDAEPLAEFNARWLSDDGPEEPEKPLAVWTRDLFTRPHPTFTPDLCTIVEDTNTGEIVSSTVFFPQTWTYEGIPFGVGRPELIATHPDYRKRGLVRLQMDTLHAWSADMGHHMQVITGIPWFYRQFGYEMALDLHGGRFIYAADISPLKDGENEPFEVRPATFEDIPFLMDTYRAMSKRHLFACEMDESVWRYAIAGSSPDSLIRLQVSILGHSDGRPAAFFVHQTVLRGPSLYLAYFALAENESWQAVTPTLLRHLLETGRSLEKAAPDRKFTKIFFQLAENHPVFRLMPRSFGEYRPPYAWYIRIPDVPGFLQHVAPALEKRLVAAELAGYSGEVKVGFYRDGLIMTFNKGKLETVTAWQPTPGDEGHVRFPDLSFLSLLCGRRSYDELFNFYADCFAIKDEYAVLMRALFPKKPSNVWGIE